MGPHFLLDKRKLEKVQRRATKLIPQLSDKSYQHHLVSLDLPSLHYRNIRGDLIFLYKLIKTIRCNTLNSIKSAIENYFNENKYMFL